MFLVCVESGEIQPLLYLAMYIAVLQHSGTSFSIQTCVMVLMMQVKASISTAQVVQNASVAHRAAVLPSEPH